MKSTAEIVRDTDVKLFQLIIQGRSGLLELLYLHLLSRITPL
jgi:hypothetical protein